MLRIASTFGPVLASILVTGSAFAQTSATPPADEAAAVAAPTAVGAPPAPPPPATDSTNATVSAGGQFATGNSQLAAITGSGKFDMRRGQNAFGAALIGNYAEAVATPPPTVVTAPDGSKTVSSGGAPAWKESTENLQGKLRYDRYFSKNLSAFLQVTGTHDAFQAVTFRLNVDPGVKLLGVNKPDLKIWGEAGYDFQYDDNYTDSNGIEQAGAGGPATDAVGADYLISQNDTIHSGRLFAGFQYSFNKDVNLNLGLEYLQGFGGTGGSAPTNLPTGFLLPNGVSPRTIMSNQTLVDPQSISLTGSRVNLNILLAAKLVGGLSFGIGFNAKYNSAPLPGKVDLDTATTLTLIYSFGGAPAPKAPEPPPPVPCVPAAPPPPPPPPVVVRPAPPPPAPVAAVVVAPAPAPAVVVAPAAAPAAH